MFYYRALCRNQSSEHGAINRQWDTKKVATGPTLLSCWVDIVDGSYRRRSDKKWGLVGLGPS